MKPITEEIETQCRKMLEEKRPWDEIKEKLKISSSTISKIKNKSPEIAGKFNASDPFIRSDAIKWIQRHKTGFTCDQLAKRLNATSAKAKEVVEYLSHHDSYNIIPQGDVYVLSREIPPAPTLNLDRLKGKEYEFGIISDPHLCCIDERLDVCNAGFDEFERRGIKDVFLPGNLIHGEWYRIFHEIKDGCFGAHKQARYFADNWPARKGITTRFITGECHEGWYQDKGMKIGYYIENVCRDSDRNDIKFIGHIEQDITITTAYGETKIRLQHPGGGCAYALSYPSQKMVESFQGGEKPNMLISGHYHKFDVCYPREVVTIMAGTACDQTRYMRLRKLAAHVGFIICKIGSRLDGTIGRLNVEFFPFYDRKYHRKLESYQINGTV